MTAIRKEMKGEREKLRCHHFPGDRLNYDSEIARLEVAGTCQRPVTSNYMQICCWGPFCCSISSTGCNFRWKRCLLWSLFLDWTFVFGWGLSTRQRGDIIVYKMHFGPGVRGRASLSVVPMFPGYVTKASCRHWATLNLSFLIYIIGQEEYLLNRAVKSQWNNARKELSIISGTEQVFSNWKQLLLLLLLLLWLLSHPYQQRKAWGFSSRRVEGRWVTFVNSLRNCNI